MSILAASYPTCILSDAVPHAVLWLPRATSQPCLPSLAALKEHWYMPSALTKGVAASAASHSSTQLLSQNVLEPAADMPLDAIATKPAADLATAAQARRRHAVAVIGHPAGQPRSQTPTVPATQQNRRLSPATSPTWRLQRYTQPQ
jgi:hypothetical protein